MFRPIELSQLTVDQSVMLLITCWASDAASQPRRLVSPLPLPLSLLPLPLSPLELSPSTSLN